MCSTAGAYNALPSSRLLFATLASFSEVNAHCRPSHLHHGFPSSNRPLLLHAPYDCTHLFRLNLHFSLDATHSAHQQRCPLAIAAGLPLSHSVYGLGLGPRIRYFPKPKRPIATIPSPRTAGLRCRTRSRRMIQLRFFVFILCVTTIIHTPIPLS